MTVHEIPITTYAARAKKPAQRYGAPARLQVKTDASRIFARVPMDKVPVDAVITSAVLRFYSKANSGSSRNLRVSEITSSWNASVRWNRQPSTGPVLDTVTKAAPNAGDAWDLDVTAWAIERKRRGLMIDTSSAAHILMGSSAPEDKPTLVIDYYVPAEVPGDLHPDGGSVSVAAPVLAYAGSDDMTQQKIDFSTDGVTVSSTTGWIPATEGRFTPTGTTPVLTDGGAGIYWRSQTDGPTGQSSPSPWAWYDYKSLPTVTFLSPGATTPDGSPPAQWSVTGGNQEGFNIALKSGSQLISASGDVNEPLTRDWTPDKGVKVPDGVGKFDLVVYDDVTPRVVAEGAPVYQRVEHSFTTTLTGAGTAVDSLAYAYEDPIPVFTGTRAAGVPDEVALVRDGALVPLWDDEGNVYPGWAPGAEFFTGTAFTLRDMTSNPREEHTWSVRTRTNGTVSSQGPTITEKPVTKSVWLIDPSNGDKIEVLGTNNLPVVSQSTSEESILHVPINAGLTTEPKRRRLLRTTRAGNVVGTVFNEAEALLDEWVERDSSTRYRLVFGKVNWSVIIGDYDPTDVFYGDNCGPDRVEISFNWWERVGP